MFSEYEVIKRIAIVDDKNSGFLDFAWDGQPSQGLFFWKGDSSNADKIYGKIQKLMDGSENIHFGNLFFSKAKWGYYAWVTLNDVPSLSQKQEIAKGMELQGYKIAVK